MSDFYAYVHILPDLTPFYVGKGTMKRAHSLCKGRNVWHQRIVAKHGTENISVETVACGSEKEAFFRERMTIAALKSAGVALCNMSDGGEGPSGYLHTDEAKRKMSVANSGKTVSAHTRELIAAANRGKATSDVTRQKLAEKSRNASSETRALLSAAGKIRSTEARKRMSIANLGKPKSAEHRAKMSAAHLARNARLRGEC